MKVIMEVKVSLTILFFCLGMANSLRCWKCMNSRGNCTETDVEVCNPSQDSCFFESKQIDYLMADTVKRGCGNSNICRRYRGGKLGSLSRALSCCSTDLCSPVKYPASVSRSPNGVTCQSCIGGKAECGPNAPSEKCYESRNQCVQISQQFLPGEEQEPIIKGCGDTSFTNTMVAYQVGKDFAYVDQKVCSKSNCNNGNFTEITAGQPNRLQCYTCKEEGNGECNRDRLKLLNCTGTMDQCVNIIKKEKTDSLVTILKGCATETICARNQEIYTRLMRQDSSAKCCKTSLCNRAGSPAPELRAAVTALALWLALVAWK